MLVALQKTTRKIFMVKTFLLSIFVCLSFSLSPITQLTELPVVPVVPFGLITNNSTHIYSFTGNTYEPITTLPYSYYCLLIDDTDPTYYKAVYMDIEGYIKKSDITLVDYEPVHKYALGTAIVTIDAPQIYLRQKPDTTQANIVSTINNLTTLDYYGYLSGNAVISGGNTDWLFITYFDGTDTLFGYIHSSYATATAPEENSHEKVMYTPTPEPSTETINPLLDSTTNIIMIVCMCLPVVIIMSLLFRKNPDQKKKPRTN